MKSYILAAALAAAAAPAYAGATDYATEQAAGVAASRAALELTTVHEYGGAVLRCGDAYRFTAPATSGESHGLTLRIKLPPGCKLAALYHSHPRGEASEMFSPHDVETARRLGVRSYIGIASTGTVRVFDPATMPTTRYRDDRTRLQPPVRGSALGLLVR